MNTIESSVENTIITNQSPVYYERLVIRNMYLRLLEKKREKKEVNTILNQEKIHKFKPTKMNSFEIQKILQEFISDLDIKSSFYPQHLMTLSRQFKIQILKEQIKNFLPRGSQVSIKDLGNIQIEEWKRAKTCAKEKIKREKTYAILETSLDMNSMFDFFTKDAFLIIRKAKLLACLLDRPYVTSELLLLAISSNSRNFPLKGIRKYLNLSNINATNVAHCLLELEDELYRDYGIPPIYTPWDNFVENLDKTSFGQKIKTKRQFIESLINGHNNDLIQKNDNNIIEVKTKKFIENKTLFSSFSNYFKNPITKTFKLLLNNLITNKNHNDFNWIIRIIESFKNYFQSDLFITHASKIVEEFSELFEITIEEMPPALYSSIFPKPIIRDIPFSTELEEIFERLDDELFVYKSPVISSETLFIAMMECRNSNAGKMIQKLCQNEMEWYVLRYRLMKRLHTQEVALRNEPINQRFFAYLLRIQLTDQYFNRMLNRGLLSVALPLYRTELIFNSLTSEVSENLNKKLKEQVKESIANSTLMSKRYYLKNSEIEIINIEQEETFSEKIQNDFENI